MLEGTLDTFTLPEILQLLAVTGKTGCLHLHRDGGQGRVWFDDGEVCDAVASSGQLALGKRLVGAGAVTAEQLTTALEVPSAGSPGSRLGRALVDQGAIDTATLEAALRDQIEDAVFELLRWGSGRFRFDAADPTRPAVTVPVDDVVAEATRRLDQWTAVAADVPGPHAVVALAPAPVASDVSLRPEQWRLVALVDGRRTVGELVTLSGQGEFETCRLLHELVATGLLEVREPAVDGAPSITALLADQELIRRLEADLDGGSGGAPTPDAPAVAAPTAPPEPAPVQAPVAVPAPDTNPERQAVVHAEPIPEPEDREPEADDLEPAPLITPIPPQRVRVDSGLDADLIDRLIDGVRSL